MKRLAALVMCLGASAALAGWSVNGEGEAGFSGSGPAGFKIDGKTKLVSVKDDGKNLTVVVGLKDLDTGISLRDKHMRDKYLEVEKFPEATLTVPLDGVKLADGANEGEAKGTFTCHGKTKDVTFKYKASCKGGECDVEGTAPVNMKEHDVNVPSYMGITVKPDITVRASFKAKKS